MITNGVPFSEHRAVGCHLCQFGVVNMTLGFECDPRYPTHVN